MDGVGVPNKAPLKHPRNIRRPGYEAYFPAAPDEVSLDEMLSLACRQGKQDIVELLLESGANVNHRNKAGNTPLLEACSQGHLDSARMLLDRGADIDTPTETTLDSALTWACTLGNEQVVDMLLTWNTNVEHRTKDGCTALMFASLAGHVEVARMLLDHKAEINVESDSNKDSPLTFACWKGHQDVVELLLDHKADIGHRTKEGFTPLMFAALGGHKEVAFSLLRHGALVNTPSGSNNDIPLTSACWKGHCSVVELLLEYHSDIEHHTKDGCTPLMLAAREGHFNVAKLLLENGAEVNVPSGSESNIPLTLACWKGHNDVVELLLQHGSDLEHRNKAGCTPLMLAGREGHFEATKLLLDHGADCNMPSGSNDDTPLTLACWKGHDNIVTLLIEWGCTLNHQTKTGCTPLMEATREGYVEVARILLEAGSDVETPDNYGQSPLFMACWKGHADVAELLLECNANKDCRTKTGITPLFQACREDNVEVVRLLIDYGCNVNIPFPNSRECPLTLCAERGYFDLISLLLDRGCNADCRTKRGCTPFFLACKEGHQKVSQLLLKHSADPEAAEAKNITPLVATFKNGHYEVVEWLLKYTNHLPSDTDCQKCLLAPAPDDADEISRSDLLHNRTKCLELIMKAKKAKEEAAQMNAQILCAELDAEREKRETKKNKKKEKRKRKHEKKMAQALSTSEGQKEVGDAPLRSPISTAGGDTLFPLRDDNVDQATLIASLSTLADSSSRDIMAEKECQRTEGDFRSSSSGVSSVDSTRSSTRGSDVASQLDEDEEEEMFEDARSFLVDDPVDFHSCQSTMPMYIKTVANSTLPEEAQVSDNTSKRHDNPAVSSHSGSSSSSRTSSNSSDTVAMKEGPGSVKRKGSKRTKTEKRLLEKPSVWHQRNGGVSNSRSDCDGLLDTIKCPSESTRSTPSGAIQTSALATNTKSATSTLSSSGKSARAHGRHSSDTSKIPNVTTHPQATDVSESSRHTGCSIPDNVITKTTTSNHAALQRRTSAPVLSSRMVSAGVNYAASVKGNLPSTTATTQHLPSSSSDISPCTLGASNIFTTANASTASDSDSNTYASCASASVARPSQDVSKDVKSTGPRNLISANDSINLILQDLDSAATVKRSTSVKERPCSTGSSTDSEEDGSDNVAKCESTGQEWDVSFLSNDCSTDDDKIRSLQEDAAAELASMGLSATASTTEPVIVQGVKMLNMSVTDSLVGRVIGLGGNKINTITRESGAQITVSGRSTRTSENRIITIRGTQKSIDRAREMIDEVLSHPDKEYEANKHRLCHAPPNGQQNRSFEVGGNYQQSSSWTSKRHSACVPPHRHQLMGAGGIPVPAKKHSLPATMKPSATSLEVPSRHFSRSPSPSSRVSPLSISPHRLSPVDHSVAGNNSLLLNYPREDANSFGALNTGGGMYGSNGSLHNTPSPLSVSPRRLSPSSYSSSSSHDYAPYLSVSPSQRKYSPSVPTILSPDDTLGCGSDASSSVTLIRSKSASPQSGLPAQDLNNPERISTSYSSQYQHMMSQESAGGTREGQFGAIGTKRELWPTPLSSYITTIANNNSATVVPQPAPDNTNPGGRRMSYAGLSFNKQDISNMNMKAVDPQQLLLEDSSTGDDAVDPNGSQDWPSQLPDAAWKQKGSGSAVPAQWLSAIAEDPKSRSFSWAGRPGAHFPVYGSMVHPQHHQPTSLSRAQSEEFIPYPTLWQDRGITPLPPPTPNGVILSGTSPSTAQPFVAPSPLPHGPAQYDPRRYYMQNLPNAMFRPIDTQSRASSGSIADSQDGASYGGGYNESVGDHMQVQQMMRLHVGQGVYAVQGPYRNKPFQPSQPAGRLMLPQQRNLFGASSAPTSPRLLHHGFNPCVSNLSLSSSEGDHLPSPVQVDHPTSKRWSVPTMTPGNHSPIPPFTMQPCAAARHGFPSSQDSLGYSRNSTWVNQDTGCALSNQMSHLTPYMSTHHHTGGNPWTNALVEETEDQAPVPSSDPHASLDELFKGLDIADQHIESLQRNNIGVQDLRMLKPDDWRQLDIPMGPRLKILNAVSNVATDRSI